MIVNLHCVKPHYKISEMPILIIEKIDYSKKIFLMIVHRNESINLPKRHKNLKALFSL